MKLRKRIQVAMYHLFFFKPYTHFDRAIEIGYGILAWFGIGIILFGIYTGITN